MRRFLSFLFGHRPTADTADPSILAGLPFEVLVVPGQEAVRARERLLARDDVTPVILGDEGDVGPFVAKLAGRDAPVADILHEAHAVDLERWMRERCEADPDSYSVPAAAWPEHPPPKGELSVPLQVLSRLPKKTVLIGLFPTSRSWEVPAHVRYGGWNACPPAEVHVALHRRWHERWGSEIACMSNDVIECTVARPPANEVEALQLAEEHMIYCPDIVHQGTQTLEGLAAALLEGRTWYFWWE